MHLLFSYILAVQPSAVIPLHMFQVTYVVRYCVFGYCSTRRFVHCGMFAIEKCICHFGFAGLVCVVWYISIFVPSISPSLTLTCLGRAGVLLRYICDRVIFYDFSIFTALFCVARILCLSLRIYAIRCIQHAFLHFFRVVGHV